MSSSNPSYFRAWMDQPHIDPATNLLTSEYAEGLQQFMSFACNQSITKETQKMFCPCSKCCNNRFIGVNNVWRHLYREGFMPDYKIWYIHGEDESMTEYANEICHVPVTIVRDDNAPHVGEDPTVQMVNDRFHDTINQTENHGDSEVRNFFAAINSANEPLYEGCRDGMSALSTATRLMSIKTDYNLSEDCVDRIADWGKNLCPEVNACPETYYEVQRLVAGLGLPYETIDVCIANCMIYWKRDSDMLSCRFCGELRYDITTTNNKVARKRMWYLPIAERLRRLYQSNKTAASMRWHAEHVTDGEIKHPSDAKAWHHFQGVYPDFAVEPRNVYLGLSTDGFNPFGRHGRQYSLWPVIVTPYNLPPSLCMRKEFLFLSVLVPGPNHPRRSLDVFLQPLINELKNLWDHGVDVYDISSDTNFRMRCVLLWTISDFPVYGMLSGWTTHGRLSCPYCQDESNAFQLKHGRKSCWFDCHRRFLEPENPYRSSTTLFRKKVKVFDRPPKLLNGREQLIQLRDFGVVDTISAGGNGDATGDGYGEFHNWHKKSIFWRLPYWKDLLLRHNLDVMHVEKNFFDNIMNTILNVPGKTKDNINSRKDLADICARRNLHLLPNGKGPVPAFRLTKEGKHALFSWIVHHVKFPDGYASNLRNCVDFGEEKFIGMKSHDCHVFMQRLMPFVFTNILPNNVHRAVAAVGAFFRDLCTRSFTDGSMRLLETKIPIIMCNLEKIFPPSFFDVMEHLTVHLPLEAQLGGPVQYRWMYPFERFMFHLRKKVKNLNRVEGSIVQQSLNEETSYLAEYYFPAQVQTKRRKPSRHDDGGQRPNYPVPVPDIFTCVGRLSGKPKTRSLTTVEYSHLHSYIVNNCDDIMQYQGIYKDQVRARYPMYSEDTINEMMDKEFTQWLKYYVSQGISRGGQFPFWLGDIIHGPFTVVTTYPRYCTRGYAFRILDRERNRKTVDSGVCSSSGKLTYYGVLREMIEVTYPGGLGLRCIAFNCDWYDPCNGVQVDEFGVVTVDSRKQLTQFDPFIIASQADQVCFLPYPMVRTRENPWLVVTKISPRGAIIGSADIHPLQQDVGGELNLPTESNDNALIGVDGTDDILEVNENEGEEFEDDSDSIPSHSDNDSE